MKNIIIIGAGGVGRETVMLIKDINRVKRTWNLLGFVDDNKDLTGKRVNDYKVLGTIDFLNDFEKEVFIVCSISNPFLKKQVFSRISNPKINYANLVHPSTIISEDCVMGYDIIVHANCIITTNVTLGNHIQVNPQCGIGHESVIKDYNSLYWNVNISGNVEVEEGCIIGTKATILQRVNIGKGSIIGAGAVVLKNIPENCTAVGVPAKLIEKHGSQNDK
jgi:sugar O-acyltransferase (sialic acid O-acetyltransferase NeuD family)